MPTCSKIDWIRIKTGIAKLVLSILGLLLLAASNDSGSSPAPTPQSTDVPMDAQAWSILYSPGMPPHPTPRTGGGWYFDFPTDPNSVHYVLAAVNMAASSYVDASILVTTTGTPDVHLQSSTKQHLRLSRTCSISIARERRRSIGKERQAIL